MEALESMLKLDIDSKDVNQVTTLLIHTLIRSFFILC